MLEFVVSALRQAGRPLAEIVIVAVALRMSYHDYYGPGVIGIAVWAAVFVWLYLRTGSVIPLIIVFLGLGPPAKIVVVFIGAAMPILINTYAGVLNCDGELIEMARSAGATDLQVFRKIMLPGSLPYITATEPVGSAVPRFKMKLAVAPICPGPNMAPGPPCTISTRSTVSSRRTNELESMKEREGMPYSGVPLIMLVKNGASPPPGIPAISMLAPV